MPDAVLATFSSTAQMAVGQLAVNRLHPSKTNPRQEFPEKSLKELADDIKARGVLEPLLVHSKDAADGATDFTIIAGERRWRAAKLAGLKAVPCRILPAGTPPEELLEIQLVENLQREDLTPLDEARGYRRLQDECKMDVRQIAAKIHKSVAYVYQFLKLSDLVPKLQEMLSDGTITTGHAILLARLTPADQATALEAMTRWTDAEIWPVKRLGQWIQEELLLNLQAAAFDKSSTTLVPDAPSCRECPKRLGNQPDASKRQEWICSDKICFQAKVLAHSVLTSQDGATKKSGKSPLLLLSADRDHKPKEGEGDGHVYYLYGNGVEEVHGKKDRCPSTRKGVIVAGGVGLLGQTRDVCVEPTCKRHFSGDSEFASPQAKAARKAQLTKEKKELERRRGILDRILETVRKAPKKYASLIMREAAVRIVDRLYDADKKRFFSRLGLEPVVNKQKVYHRVDFLTPYRKALTSDEKTLELIAHSLAVGDLFIPTYLGRDAVNGLEDLAKKLGLKV